MSEAEDAGSIVSEIRLSLTQMDKDALEAQRKMDNLANKFKQQGQNAGKGFAGGVKKGFDEVDQSAAKLGRNIGKSLAPQMLALQAGIKIIQGIAGAFKDAFMSNEKFANGISDLKSSLGASFTAATKPVTDFFANLIEKAAKSAKQAKLVQDALKRLKEESASAADVDLGTNLEDTRMQYEALTNRLIEYERELVSVEKVAKASGKSGALARGRLGPLNKEIDETKEALKGLKIILDDLENKGEGTKKDTLDLFSQAQREFNKALAETAILENSNGINRKQAIDSEVSALNNYINKMAELITKDELKGTYINEVFDQQIAKREELIKLAEAEAEKEGEIKARISAIEKYNQAVQKARDAQKAGLIDEEEMEKQISAALEQQYNDLESIITQYKLITGETVNLRNATAEDVKQNKDLQWLIETRAKQAETITNQEIAQLRAKASVAKTENEKNALLSKAITLENEIIEKQREQERIALQNSESFKAQSEDVKNKILGDFDQITEGMKASQESIETNKGGGSLLANAFGISDEKLGHMMQVGGAMVDAFDNISGAMLEISRQHAEEQIAIIEEALQSTLDSIEKARKEALIAAGFAVANNEESLEAQLEAAKRTGDEVLIYQTERRLEEQRINDEYDAQAKAAEEEAAKEKAAIAFKMAKEEYALKMIQAVNSGIMAVMHALASPVPWPVAVAFGAAAATASGVQIGLLAANPPKPPKFANSGIVPGNKYAGDRMTALVDSGELILNRAHQDNIANQLTSNSAPVTATIFVMMDSREIAQSTVDLVNNGQYTIKVRALA